MMPPLPGSGNNPVVGATLHDRPPRFQRLLRMAGGDDRERRGESRLRKGGDCPADPRDVRQTFILLVVHIAKNNMVCLNSDV